MKAPIVKFIAIPLLATGLFLGLSRLESRYDSAAQSNLIEMGQRQTLKPAELDVSAEDIFAKTLDGYRHFAFYRAKGVVRKLSPVYEFNYDVPFEFYYIRQPQELHLVWEHTDTIEKSQWSLHSQNGQTTVFTAYFGNQAQDTIQDGLRTAGAYSTPILAANLVVGGTTEANVVSYSNPLKLLGMEQLSERECYVIEQYTGDQGVFQTHTTFWIDKETYLIRKIIHKLEVLDKKKTIITEEMYSDISFN